LTVIPDDHCGALADILRTSLFITFPKILFKGLSSNWTVPFLLCLDYGQYEFYLKFKVLIFINLKVGM